MPACRRYLAVAAALALAAASSLALAACGGSGSPPAASASADDAGLKFARCMRQHGVPFPDPNASGHQTIQIKDPQAFRSADRACARYRPTGPKNNLTPAQQAEFQDKALKFSRCMRAHGVDMPDPQTSSRGGAIKIAKGAGGGPDPSSPAFQSAQKACESLLPKGRGGNQSFHTEGSGGGGGGGGSVSIQGGKGG